jgi:AraC-like DNA-binding protein
MDLPFSLPSTYRLASSRTWGRTQGLTVTPTGPAEGRREFMSFRQGFYLSLGHVTHLAESREIYRGGDFIKLHFRLEGESRVGQCGTPAAPAAQAVEGMSVSTLLQPAGAAKEEIFGGQVRERSVTLCCSRGFLAEHLGLPPQGTLGGPFGTFMRAPPERFELSRFPLSAPQRDIVAGLLDHTHDDTFRALYAEAKAFELLHGFLAAHHHDDTPAQGDPQATAMRERLAPVRAYIDTHLDQALELRDLAQRFGLSESRLSRGFRQGFDMSLFDYVTRRRLTQARTLLENGRLSVTQVALEVGYGHAANFSTAFRRHFGISPRAVWKGRATRPLRHPPD